MLAKSTNVSARFTLLFVCDNPEACPPFRKSLRDAGLRLLSVREMESAIMRSSHEPVDGFLVHLDDIQVGSTIGSQLKTLFRNTPLRDAVSMNIRPVVCPDVPAHPGSQRVIWPQ